MAALGGRASEHWPRLDSGKGRGVGSSSAFSPRRQPQPADAVTGFRRAGGGPPKE